MGEQNENVPPAAIKKIIPLQYASGRRGMSRRATRLAIIAAIMICLLVAGWLVIPKAWRYAEATYWEGQCMICSPSQDSVVFERLPAGSASPAVVAPFMDGGSAQVLALMRVGIPQTATLGGSFDVNRVPDCWVRFLQASRNGSESVNKGTALVFCHQRISPGGHSRLVTVELPEMEMPDTNSDGAAFDFLIPKIYAPTGWNGSPSLLNGAYLKLWVYQKQLPRVFAGQADPGDLSHFTIEYEWLDRLRGFIDGWLLDNDTVKLVYRSGLGEFSREYLIKYDADHTPDLRN